MTLMALRGLYGSTTSWWFQTCFIFHHILGIFIPTDKLIFFRGVGIPPTRMALRGLYGSTKILSEENTTSPRKKYAGSRI